LIPFERNTAPIIFDRSFSIKDICVMSVQGAMLGKV
jgi:hypothetical protein